MRAVPALKTLPDDALAQLSARGLVVRKAAANRVEVSAGGRVSQMALIVHTGPGMPSPERIADAKAETDLPVLITAVSIGPKAGSRLEGAGLHYVDLAGNASVHLPGIAVSVEGRPRVPLPSRYAVTAAFRRAGLQAVGTILSRPEHPVPTLRVVAEQAGALEQGRGLQPAARQVAGLVDRQVEGVLALGQLAPRQGRQRESVAKGVHRRGLQRRARIAIDAMARIRRQCHRHPREQRAACGQSCRSPFRPAHFRPL